jgi:SAM-dependent methyltransferase
VDQSLWGEARRVRAELEAGTLRGAPLLQRLLSVPPAERDVFTDEVLGLGEAPPDVAPLPRGAVPYLPSGVEEILALLREAPVGPDDELVDLGSGLGRVVLLAHLLCGARARGVELQEPLVRRATARRDQLGLSGVEFVHADAAQLALDGSIFYLYAPFSGETLARVLRNLEDVARRRPIVVGAVGVEFRDRPWLRPRPTSCLALTLYDARP